MRTIGVLVALLIGAAACVGAIDAFDPEVGPPVPGLCSDTDLDLERDVSFSTDVQPVFLGRAATPGCGCHLPTVQNPIGLEQTGLDLSSFDALTAGGVNSHGTIVIPGAPCQSVLIQKISAAPPFGSRMPFSGPPFVDEATIRMMADWVAEGALDD